MPDSQLTEDMIVGDSIVNIADGRAGKITLITGVVPHIWWVRYGEAILAVKVNVDEIKLAEDLPDMEERHMSKGQQAMAVAILHPEPEQGKRSDLVPPSFFKNEVTLKNEVAGSSVRKARAVLLQNPNASKAVIAGTTSLNKAYADIRASSV